MHFDQTKKPGLLGGEKEWHRSLMQNLANEASETNQLESIEWKRRYERLIYLSGEVLYDWDAEENRVSYVGNLKELIGYDQTEIGMSLFQWIEKIHPADQKEFHRRIKAAIATRSSFEVNIRARHSNGDYIELQDRGQVYVDRNGKLKGLMGFLRNISEETRREKEYKDLLYQLRESQKTTQTLMHSLGIFVGVCAPDGTNIDINEVALKVSRVRRKEILGLKLWQAPWWAFSAEIQEQIRLAVEQARQGHEQRFDVAYQVAGEVTKWADFSIRPVMCENGTVVKLIASGVDITERVLKDREERAQADLFKQLAKYTPQHIFVANANGNILYSNRDWFTAMGLDAGIGAVCDLGWRAVTHPDDFTRLVTDWENSITTGVELNAQYRFKHHNDSFRWVWVRLRPIKDQIGNVVKWFGIATDYDDQKRAELALAKSREDLETILLKKSNDLRVVRKDLTDLSQTVRDDLRAPLRSIQGFGEYLLKDEKLSDRGQKDLVRVLESSKLLGELIDDLFSITKISSREIINTNVNCKQLIKKLFKTYTKKYPNRTIEFVADEIANTDADPFLVENLFSLLLDNACKFTSPNPVAKIEIGSQKIDNQVVYYVRDNGIGFNMAYQEKIFGVFQRLHTTKEFPGNGTGLAIAKRIVGLHGGKIWATSEQGRGSTFYFTLSRK